MGTQSIAILHLAPLEETREEEEEPHSIGHSRGASLRMVTNEDGRLASGLQPHTPHDHNCGTYAAARLPIVP